MNKRLQLALALLAFVFLSCQFVTGAPDQQSPAPATLIAPADSPTTEPLEGEPGVEPGASQATISPIIFCNDVKDGEPQNPGDSFPAGTTQVWAFFTYQGMADGQLWSRKWLENGEVYHEAIDEAWEDGESGWVAYSIADPNAIPLSGRYRLVLYIGEQEVQTAEFDVEATPKPEASGFPAFGPIQFAGDITPERIPVGVASEFEPGIKTVYAVFPYQAIPPDQQWGKEWLLNGEPLDQSEGAWGTPSEGLTYLYIETQNENGLAPGTYTLNLLLDGQVARSAEFEVLGGPRQPAQPPAAPEEVIAPDMLEAWQLLYDARDQYNFLHDLAQFVLDQHIEVGIDEEHVEGVGGYYMLSADMCQPTFQVGYVMIMRDYWNDNGWEAVASVLAHELTHSQQHFSGDYRCPGCSVNAEYWARIAEFYTLLMLGREDLIYDWPVFNDDGSFSSDKVWLMTKELYGDDCPDY